MSFFDNPIFIILMLVAFFGVIVLIVFLIRKYSKHFHSDEKPKTAREIADEELDRVLVDVEDEETRLEMEMEAEARAADPSLSAPSPKEAAREETIRATEEIEDPAIAEQMARYAAEHPEEGAQAEEDSSEKEDR